MLVSVTVETMDPGPGAILRNGIPLPEVIPNGQSGTLTEPEAESNSLLALQLWDYVLAQDMPVPAPRMISHVKQALGTLEVDEGLL